MLHQEISLVQEQEAEWSSGKKIIHFNILICFVCHISIVKKKKKQACWIQEGGMEQQRKIQEKQLYHGFVKYIYIYM